MIYNITFGVDNLVCTEFIQWLRDEFIPVSLAENEYFAGAELMKVVNDDHEVTSLALHLRADSVNDLNVWYEDCGSRLFDYIQRKWAGRVVFFTTTLEVL